MKLVFIALALLVTCSATPAAERITSYYIDIGIRADGALDVTESITATVEGNQIRHGIYRDFPTRYRDRYGNRVVVDLQVLSVERDDNPEYWEVQRRDNGVRIMIGSDDSLLPVPAHYTYRIHYRTTRQMGFFADHDELYWNAIGTGWIFPIDAATVEARLPTDVPVDELHAEGYTGPQGAKGQNYETELPDDGVARWHLKSPLNQYEGLTIVLTFPKGIVTPPTTTQRLKWFFSDNGGVLIAVVGLLLLLAFCIYEWNRVGRDPRRGIVIARYQPPAGQSPASLRYLRRMSYDTRCFSSAVLQLAVERCVKIVKESKLFKDEWRIERDATGTSSHSVGETTLLDGLFTDGSPLVLKDSNAAAISAAISSHRRLLNKAMQPRYFSRNGWSTGKAVLIDLLMMGLALVVAQGAGIPAIVCIGVVSVVTLIVFASLVRAPTVEGRKLMDEIEGLKLYMSVAERDELARMTGPDGPPELDAKRYETLLPYAVALEVEEAWTRKFTLAVGAAAAAAAANNIGWYQGGNVSDLGSLTSAVGSSLTSQIASSSTPPGSSSGSGGGGSSGGGGGGGGGGGH